MPAQQLFTFVTAVPFKFPSGEAKPMAGTNNESERALRSAAEAGKRGRTDKTLRSAGRQTILVSVLESFCQQLTTFTLMSVSDEILQCFDAVLSCFATLLAKLQLTPSKESILDLVLTVSSG